MLCTPDTSFQLRQVQTSNTLFVTHPTLDAHANKIPVPTTCAIASCPTTLELHPAEGSAPVYLENLLPLYDIVDGEVDASGNGKSKASIFKDIPFSDGQCGQAWRDIMAFEFAGSSWRPSANTLAQVWRSINAAALADGVRLDSQFLIDDVAGAVAEEAYPATLAVAILQRLASDEQEKDGLWSCLDRTKTVSFVGKVLLEARRRQPAYLTADFLDTWKDNLPEAWREGAELKTIPGVYNLPTPTTIELNQSTAVDAEHGPPSKSGTSSRKWHEKFGRARQS